MLRSGVICAELNRVPRAACCAAACSKLQTVSTSSLACQPPQCGLCRAYTHTSHCCHLVFGLVTGYDVDTGLGHAKHLHRNSSNPDMQLSTACARAVPQLASHTALHWLHLHVEVLRASLPPRYCLRCERE